MKRILKSIIIFIFIIIQIFYMAFKSYCLTKEKDIKLYQLEPWCITTKNFTVVDSLREMVRDIDNKRHTYYTYRPRSSTIKFGKYKHKDGYGNDVYDIDWIVLAKCDGRALLVSRDVLDTNMYNASGEKCAFSDSSLNLTLNTVFYNNAFSDKEKEYIMEYTPTGGKVFILSEYELDKYMGLNITPKEVWGYINDDEKNHVDTLPKGFYTFASYKYDVSAGYGDNIDAGTTNSAYWVRSDEVIEKAKSVLSGKITKKDLKKVNGFRPAIWVSYSQEGQDKFDEIYKKITEKVISLFNPMELFKSILGDIDIPINELPDELKDKLKDELKNKLSDKLEIDEKTWNALSFDAMYEYVNADYLNYTITGWVADKYYRKNELLKNDWVKWDNEWYYVDNNGMAEKNKWKKKENDNYYLDKFGKIAREQWIENKYYVNRDGLMLTNTTTPDGHYVDANGERVINGNDDNFNYSLTLDLDINKKKNEYTLFIKNVPKNSDAEKLGLDVGDTIIELDADLMQDILNELFVELEKKVGTSKNAFQLIKSSAIRSINKLFKEMDFTYLTIKKLNGKIVEMTKEEIISKLK